MSGVSIIKVKGVQDATDALRQGKRRPRRQIEFRHHFLQDLGAVQGPPSLLGEVLSLFAVLLVMGRNEGGLVPRHALPGSDGAQRLQKPQDGPCLLRLLHRLEQVHNGQ